MNEVDYKIQPEHHYQCRTAKFLEEENVLGLEAYKHAKSCRPIHKYRIHPGPHCPDLSRPNEVQDADDA